MNSPRASYCSFACRCEGLCGPDLVPSIQMSAHSLEELPM